jgi:hypothetical protein
MEKSTFEKDYEFIRGMVIISLIPAWMKVIFYIILITLPIFFLHIYLSHNECRVTREYPPILFDNLTQPFFVLFWNIWHLIKFVFLYAYFGVCS